MKSPFNTKAPVAVELPGKHAVEVVKLRLFTATVLLPLFCLSDVVNASAGEPLGSDSAAVQFPVTVLFVCEFPPPQAVEKTRAEASINQINFINLPLISIREMQAQGR